MTPFEYVKIEAEQQAIIKTAGNIITAARTKAERAKPPKTQLRRARADDIRPGLIVWHERSAKCGGWYWHVVEEPLHYQDDFKAYTADDGSRYGLDGAWVYANNGVTGDAGGGVP